MAATIRELLVRIDTNTTGLTKGLQKGEAQIKRFSGVAATMGRTLLGVFAIDRVFRYGKAIVETTAEFEKLETVLTSTLGSSSMAQKSFELIAKFAAKTPFTVQEVTQSFVKLANRGVVPAYQEMERMADVASVLGKPFQQLVEAILDVSNSKRWTELGIKAENAGDKVRLTFRGVTKEVERSEAGVMGAITAFGEMKGVFGVTAKVAETTAGKLGELGDNAIFLQKNIGDSQSGLIHGFLTLANEALGGVNKALAETNKLTKNLDLAKIEGVMPSFLSKIAAAGAGPGAFIGLMANTASEATAKFAKVQDEVKGIFNEISQDGELLAKPGDSIAILEAKMTMLNKALEERQFYKYTEFLTKEAEPALAEITKQIQDQTKATNDQEEADKAALETKKELIAEQHKAAIELSRIEKDARDSEKPMEFDMPSLEKSAGYVNVFDQALSNINSTYQSIADGNYVGKMADDIEKSVTSANEFNDSIKQSGESALYLGQTFANVFSSMILDGGNAIQILIDSVKKLAARLAGAAIAAGLVSVFLGGGGAVLGSLGGFKGVFSALSGLPAFANGGLVSGPTMGLVGEGPRTSKSNPEVIAPLDKLQGMLGGGGQLVARVEGRDLLFILDRAQRDYNRS